MIVEPEEGTYAADALKLDLKPAAGHGSAVSTPAGLVIKISAIHVEILTDLFELAFRARQPFMRD